MKPHALRLLGFMLLFPVFLHLRAEPAPARKRPPLNFFEYNRGLNLDLSGTVRLRTGSADLRFEHLRFAGRPFQTDRSIIPNAFLVPLLTLKLKRALENFTDPYYAIRFVHFFRRHPGFGLGCEFIHFKIFLDDLDQSVRVRGRAEGKAVDRRERAGDRLAELSISHGVNHLSLLVAHRWRLHPTGRYPDGTVQPYLSASVGPLIPHLQLAVWENGKKTELSNRYQFSWKNLGLGAAAGLRIHLRPHLGLYAEYKFTWTDIRRLTLNGDPAGLVQTSFPAHHLGWGVSWIW